MENNVKTLRYTGLKTFLTEAVRHTGSGGYEN